MNRRAFLLALSFLITTAVTPVFAATLTGKVLFEGQAPEADLITADADPNCALLHPDGITPDDVIVNDNGTLKNVFVYVKEGLEDQTFEAPKTPVQFDQHGCMYTPKVFGIMVGQTLEITNSDDTLHNVHSLAEVNKAFNLGMPLKGMKIKKTFDKPEVMIKIKCDVHPWMGAYCGVLTHPFHSVTGDDGSFTIADLPAGTYTLEAWHEKYGTQTQEVTVADGDASELTFQFKG